MQMMCYRDSLTLSNLWPSLLESLGWSPGHPYGEPLMFPKCSSAATATAVSCSLRTQARLLLQMRQMPLRAPPQ